MTQRIQYIENNRKHKAKVIPVLLRDLLVFSHQPQRRHKLPRLLCCNMPPRSAGRCGCVSPPWRETLWRCWHELGLFDRKLQQAGHQIIQFTVWAKLKLTFHCVFSHLQQTLACGGSINSVKLIISVCLFIYEPVCVNSWAPLDLK